MAIKGLKGNLLPDSEADFADNYDAMKFKRCVNCDEGFTAANTHSLLGWRETQSAVSANGASTIYSGDENA
jgi:hypothetical protein